jgi:hypothetical protein
MSLENGKHGDGAKYYCLLLNYELLTANLAYYKRICSCRCWSGLWCRVDSPTFRINTLSPFSGLKTVCSFETLLSTYEYGITTQNNIDIFTALRTSNHSPDIANSNIKTYELMIQSKRFVRMIHYTSIVLDIVHCLSIANFRNVVYIKYTPDDAGLQHPTQYSKNIKNVPSGP